MSSPDVSSQNSFVPLSGNPTIDALVGGSKWGAPGTTAATVTFSFPWTSSSNAVFDGLNGASYSDINEAQATEHFGLSPVQQTAFRAALQSWANVANVKFVEIPDTSSSVGDIRVGWTSATTQDSTGSGAAWGWAQYPSAWPAAGDVWISTNSSATTDQDWSVGSYNYMAMIHELGHSLGLKHPFEDGATLDAAHDNRLYSVMAYDDAPNDLFVKVTTNSNGLHSWTAYHVVPDTPMVDDILAMQYLYGANTSYHAQDDTYTFDPTTPFFRTLWDAGGNDTISVANFTQGCQIDLRPGHYSSLHMQSDTGAGINWQKAPPTPTYDGTNNLGIAYGTTIENAIGGSGNDTIIGNDVANHLQGNGGSNILDGGAGIDTAVYTGHFSDYSIKQVNGGYTVTLKADPTQNDTLSNIERLSFSDATMSFGLDGVAEDPLQAQYTAMAQKLYVAYFGRPADYIGLNNMVSQLEALHAPTNTTDLLTAYHNNSGIASLIDSFGLSQESAALYGSGTNADFVQSIFQHLLGRTASGDGFQFWVSALDGGGLSHSLAALNILQGAETNTTPQGLLDGQLVAERVTVASNFYGAFTTAAEINAYAGADAAAQARAMLAGVSASTNVVDYESTVIDTMNSLLLVKAALVGVSDASHGAVMA